MIKLFVAPLNYSLGSLYQKEEGEILIGVDKAAYHALKNGITLDYVLGDFDSVTDEEKAYIDKHARKVERFPVRKDKTDSDLALTKALSIDPSAKIIMYGGIGSRLDHTYGNLLMLRRGNVTIRTDQHMARVLTPGTHRVDNPHAYVSFFAVEPVKALSLKGFSYELDSYDLDITDPLCISNQGSGEVSFNQGELLMIASDDQ
ncbi:MAG: thiamine diphosphokinase [Candidatus Izemoplasmataceae bacterium]